MNKVYTIIFLLAFLLVPDFVFAQIDKKEDVSFVVFGHIYPDYEALEKSVEKVNQLKPDFVVFNGDTLPNNHQTEWEVILEITDKFSMPVYFVPGNHDIEDRSDDRQNFIEKIGPLYQSFELKNINFLFLNSSDVVAPIATYDILGTQLEWLKENFKKDKQNIVFVHHCLFYEDEVDLCNNRGQTISESNNWNFEVVPFINSNTLGVFVGDVGSRQPYFAYQENGIDYYGVGFSEREYKFPQHFLHVVVSEDDIVVNPIAVHEDIAGLNFKKIEERLPSYRENIPRFSYERLRMIMIVYLKKMRGGSTLDEYNIEIKYDDLQKMNEGLNEIGDDMVFEDDMKALVPAKFYFDGKEYNIEISYRGLQDIHWNADKKSYSIRFDKDKTFKGIRKLNLILPLDRKYFVEYLNSYRAKKFDLIYVDTKFINLRINGKLHGVYLQQEGWSNEYLDNIGKSSKGKLFKTRDIRSDFCKDREAYYDCIKSYTSLWELSAGNEDGDEYDELKKLFEIFSIEDNKSFAEEVEKIVDIEKFLKWNVHYLLAQSYHQGISNLRLYFDPESKRFEPVVWDVNMDMNHRHENIPSNIEQIDIKYNPIVDRFLSVPEFRHRRNEILWEYISDKDNLNDDISFYDEVYKDTKLDFYRDRLKRKSNFSFDDDVERFRNNFINYFNNLKNIFEQGSYIVETKKYDEKIISIDIITESFVTNILDEISFGLSNDLDTESLFSIYQDTNNNKVFDTEDELLISSVTKDNKIVFKDLDGVMYTKYLLEKGVIESVTENRFFLVSNNNILLSDLVDINFVVLNKHSQKEIKNFGIR